MEWTQMNLGDQKIMKYFCETDIYMVLLSGTAEIDGSEIPLSKAVDFLEGDYGILQTFSGCVLQYRGKLKKYISSFEEENGVPNLCLNIHSCLEDIRAKVSKNSVGPRVMICGNIGYGKTRLSRCLVNYALRDFKRITYIDAEVYYNDLSLPGSLSAMVVTQPYNTFDGWNIGDDMVTFNFGRLAAVLDPELYILQLRTLMDLVEQKFKNDKQLATSGFIVNFDSFDDGDSSLAAKEKRAAIIKSCIDYLKIDYVFVLEDGFLVQLIQKDLKKPKATIIRLPMPVQRINTLEDEDRMHGKIISSYFTGHGNIKIHLRTFSLSRPKFRIYRLEPPQSNAADRLKSPLEMPISSKFKYSFLAVSQAKSLKDVYKMPIYGYVMVIEVINNEVLKIMTPAAEKLPSDILLYTEVKTKYFT